MSGISWTEKTWNPVAGCSLESPGCTNCYAMIMARRLEAMNVEKYRGLTRLEKGRPIWTGEMRMASAEEIASVRRLRKPRLIFVNSMSDLFHPALSDKDIFGLLDIMADLDRHRFQVLTKRPGNMARVIDLWLADKNLSMVPDHIWLGVSAEDRKRAAARIPLLATIPARTRFVSLEPLLEAVDVAELPLVEWYIVGGESADKGRARVFNPDWARQIRDAVRGKAAFHFKQLGTRPTIAGIAHRKGADIHEFPEDLRIREWPADMPGRHDVRKTTRKAA